MIFEHNINLLHKRRGQKMKQLHYIIILISVLTSGIISPMKAQISEDSELFKTLKANDSLLFNLGFNECELTKFTNLTTEDLEFYHDKAGVLKSSKEFVNAMSKGICKKDNPYKSRRELVDGSLEVYPLYDNGQLYGAVQNGEHLFYEKAKNQPESLNGSAKFSTLWVLEGEEWKIKRIYSFDHQAK